VTWSISSGGFVGGAKAASPQERKIMSTTRTAFTCLLAATLVSCATGTATHDTEADPASIPAPAGSPSFERRGAEPLINFGGVQRDLAGSPTRVLVLGTPHLNNLPAETFEPAMLSLLLEALENFSPDIIAIEAVNGRTCDEIQRYRELYPTTQKYCRSTDAALKALKMTRPEAATAVEQTLAAWPADPTARQRRRLALLFSGAGEPWSAALQWSLLDERERTATDGISKEMGEQLDKDLGSRNENRLIGIELAARLGHSKLVAIDDHSADLIQTRAPDTMGPAVKAAWSKPHPLEKEFTARREAFSGSPEKIIESYLFLNSEPFQRYSIEKDFGQAAATPDYDAAARQYVAWWQTRGLRMAANVIEAAGNHPGARILVITGSSHKAYFEAYLDQMHDIELVDLREVLSAP
jgi:hypothetical protein